MIAREEFLMITLIDLVFIAAMYYIIKFIVSKLNRSEDYPKKNLKFYKWFYRIVNLFSLVLLYIWTFI